MGVKNKPVALTWRLEMENCVHLHLFTQNSLSFVVVGPETTVGSYGSSVAVVL